MGSNSAHLKAVQTEQAPALFSLYDDIDRGAPAWLAGAFMVFGLGIIWFASWVMV